MEPILQKAPVLAEMARFIAQHPQIDEATLHQATRVYGDTLGVAYSGARSSAFEMALQNRDQLFGAGSVDIWATDHKTTLMGAAFYNALSVSATDFDEGHRKAVGHPASLVVPVSQALATHLNKPFKEVLSAMIIGYEIGTRFSNARFREKITTYSSGRWGAIAAAASSAYLLKLNPEKTMHALSLASVLSPAMLGGSSDVSTGSMSKEGVAWAAQSGLQSTLLAQKGFIGPYVFVDEHDDYDRERLLRGLGESWLINSNYFKPFSCCRWLHPAIEAAHQLKDSHEFLPDEIAKIEIGTFGRAKQLISSKYPENEIQAQFHMPYVVSAMLLFGQVAPKQFSPFFLKNARLLELIDRTILRTDKSFDTDFPARLGSSLTLTLSDGQKVSTTINSAPWDADSQPSDDELKQKFLLQTGQQGEQLWEEIFSN